MNELEDNTDQDHAQNDGSCMLRDESQDAGQSQAGKAMVKVVSLPAMIDSVPKAIELAQRFFGELECPPKVQKKLVMAIDEVVSNIAKFAYGPSKGDLSMRLSFDKDRQVAEIDFVDQGIAFNPLDVPLAEAAKAVANRRIGGQGIFLLKELADVVEYEREDGKNILRVCKHIGREPKKEQSYGNQ